MVGASPVDTAGALDVEAVGAIEAEASGAIETEAAGAVDVEATGPVVAAWEAKGRPYLRSYSSSSRRWSSRKVFDFLPVL
jgi:hypothetical protein